MFSRIPGHFRYVFSVMALLLALYALLRIAFIVYNQAQAHALPWGTLFTSMLVGLRFDIATIFIFNGALFFLLSLPLSMVRHPLMYRIVDWLVLLVNIPALIVNGVDIIYYSYAEKRLTHELFTTGSDMINLDPAGLFVAFWPLFLVFIVLIILFMWLMRRISRKAILFTMSRGNARSLKAWTTPVFFLLLLLIGIRGGLQKKWLNPRMAFVTSNFFAGNVGLNSAFTVLCAYDREEKSLQLTDQQAAVDLVRQMVTHDFDSAYYSPQYPFYRYASFAEPEKRYNVVILLIESLNAEMTGCIGGKSFTPTLDSLADAGLLFTHFHSNGSRSIEAQPAVLNSMPDVFMRPIIGSHYENLHHRGLAHILGEKGYSTGYFMGCNRGVLGISQYAEVSGFQHYYGMEEYPHKEKDYDKLWGIFDEPFMVWMAEQQDQMPKPFFTAFFSCTNHHPFPLPETGADDIKAMDVTPQERTVIYTDRAVRSYLRKVREYPWADSTLFILTGDHCFYMQSDPGRAMPDQFHVPLILNGPGIGIGIDGRVGSQVCIQPTVIDYLHLDTWHASTGTSLLQTTPHPFAINNLMGMVSFTQDGASISTSLDRNFSASLLEGGSWKTLSKIQDLSPERRKDMEQKVMSLYQVLQRCRVEDTFVPPTQP